ncbi:MAG TPA: response regulator [Thermoanaerobaculaceae bacterium]|nr:response regulator [Thermoanaerobaculaceae bacterium]HRS15945.1 response regulator [Thermoanaerobaculaceae bacterium]
MKARAAVRVLIVDDELAHAEAIRLAFERESPEVEIQIVSSLAASRAAVATWGPDLVLMDVRLPDGNAVEALEAGTITRSVPVLAMTSYGDEGIAVRAMKAGAFDYIVKSAESFRNMPRTVARALREWTTVTAKARAEEALRESERRFEILTQVSPVGVFRTDRHGATTFVNPKWCEIAGMRAEDALGHGWLAAVHPEDREWVRAGWQEQPPERRTLTAEYRFLRPDGSVAWVMGQVVPETDAEGLLTGFVGTLTDITARKLAEEARERAEAALLQAQKLESVGRLAGGVAHDFNNVLQAMMATVQSLLLRSPDAATARAAAEIEKHVRRGAALTRQLLLFSRREPPKIEPVDINELVREAAVLLRRLLPENIAFATEFVPGDALVDGDRGQLGQVLMNLAVNARDAMPGGGRLLVRVGLRGDAEAFIEVSDTGTGMPASVRERVFDPFFTTKGAGHGTGLGLAVVHGIVTQHGGHIEVESEPGRGSTFRVVLPRGTTGRAVEPEDETGQPPARGRGERVLVVEDEESAREGLAELLDLLGYQPTAVACAEEALALPQAPAFDVLVSDLMLPGMSGGRLASILLARWPALRVILMSGYLEDERVQHEVPPGVRFLQKPFDAEALAREIRRALETRTS